MKYQENQLIKLNQEYKMKKVDSDMISLIFILLFLCILTVICKYTLELYNEILTYYNISSVFNNIMYKITKKIINNFVNNNGNNNGNNNYNVN